MSTIRMTGLISGLDTESIIKELMSAQRLKNKKTSDKLTLSEWKEDKWKELNAKLYKLYTEDLNKVRLQGSYQTKKASASNDALVEVTGSSSAPEGAHILTIDKLASSQYVTGGKLGANITTKTTLQEMGMDITSSETVDGVTTNYNSVIKFTNGDKEKYLVLTETTTLNDFINSCKDVGLNASYDTTQQRLFISSKESGANNKFTITTETISSDGTAALDTINTLVGTSGLTSTEKAQVADALAEIEKIDDDAALQNLYETAYSGGKDAANQSKVDAINVLIKYAKVEAHDDAVAQVKNQIGTTLINGGSKDDVVKNYLLNQNANKLGLPTSDNEVINKTNEEFTTLSQSDKDTIFNKLVDAEYKSTDLVDGDTITKAQKYQNDVQTNETKYVEDRLNPESEPVYLLDELKKYAGSISSAGTLPDLSKIGLGIITGDKVTPEDTDPDTDLKMTVVEATNASITLDGAKLTGTSNTITVNGMTIKLKGTTTPGASVTLDVSNDMQATYDMVKNFINSYDEILKEMNSLYYADSAKGYDPLSDDEKESMSDDQIEKWETKIKDSILRRDSTLGTVIDSMKTAMMSSVTVGGKKYSLSTFGIQTSTDYTEKGLLHIYGNKDDATYSDKDDKLMKALSEDPDATIEALSGIFSGLYDTMNDKMSSIPNVRSIYKFYNDKLMDKEQDDYKKQVAVLEDKLTEMENKYYKQFSAMETALAKMQSQSNALSGLLGTSK